MKKVLFTERQLHYILGENFESYLPDKDCGTKESDLSYATEVGVSDKDMNGDSTDVPMTDKISHRRAPKYPMHRYSVGGLCERNQVLDRQGKCVRMGQNTQDMLSSIPDGTSKMVDNMKSEGGMTHNSAAVRKTRLSQLKKTNPAEYARIGGKAIEKALKDTLDTKRGSVASSKQVAKDSGMNDNAFKKTHSSNDNGVTYFN